jgi:ABC-type sugar transport system ATPase subunit
MRLVLEGFTKRFGDNTVIDGLDLTVQDGEMIALLGPSGCGKSTTLFAIAGLHRVDGGRILFGDRDVAKVSAQERNVGIVFQNYALYPHMSVAQNIAFPARARRKPRPRSDRKVRAIADLVRIGELLERKPAQLSAGSSSAWRWRVHWYGSRTCFCSTSRWRTSTRNCGWRCAPRSGGCNWRPGSPPFSSPMTRSRR